MLNIKNPEAHRLAGEVAELTGESLTTAVVEALRERRDRLRRERSREGMSERLLEIGRLAVAEADPPWREGEDPTAFLYDPESGLPK